MTATQDGSGATLPVIDVDTERARLEAALGEVEAQEQALKAQESEVASRRRLQFEEAKAIRARLAELRGMHGGGLASVRVHMPTAIHSVASATAFTPGFRAVHLTKNPLGCGAAWVASNGYALAVVYAGADIPERDRALWTEHAAQLVGKRFTITADGVGTLPLRTDAPMFDVEPVLEKAGRSNMLLTAVGAQVLRDALNALLGSDEDGQTSVRLGLGGDMLTLDTWHGRAVVTTLRDHQRDDLLREWRTDSPLRKAAE